MFKREWINTVRELLERNLDILEIARRSGLDVNDVSMIVEIIKNIVL
jgi:hypothetical protein